MNPYLIPYTNITSKWNIDLNVRAKIMTLLGENIGVSIYGLVLANDFLDISPIW